MLRQCGVLAALTLTMAAGVMPVRPSLAAEQVVISVGGTNLLSIPVAELATYAQTGQPSAQLQPLIGFLQPRQATLLRNALTYTFLVNPQPLSQFLRSNLGTSFLGEMGAIFQPSEANLNSVQALQTAIDRAAADGRFTLLEVMNQYPAPQLVIDQQALQARLNQLETAGNDLQLLLAAFGVQVDVANARLDLNAFRNLFATAETYVQNVRQFATASGLSLAELQGPTPPTGTVTLQKAEIYRLYQQLEQLGQRAQQVLQQSGIQVEFQQPGVQ